MKQVTRYQTLDGQEFPSLSAAKKHAEACYANALCATAHQLAELTKYKQFCEFIDSNLVNFERLKMLREDIKLESPDDEELELT